MLHRTRMHVEAAGATDCGTRHVSNEDSFVFRPDLGLFVVADGFGGAAGGGRASSLAVRTIERYWEGWRQRGSVPSASEERRRLVWSFGRADARVLDDATANPAFDGMATTLAAMTVVDDQVVLAHVGDSRVYRARGGKLERLTKDHSVAEDEAFRADFPDEPELSDPTKQRLLTQLVGRGELVSVATRIERVLPEDVYLLCTDGLSAVLHDHEIAQPILDAPALVQEMIRAHEAPTPQRLPLMQCHWYLGTVDRFGRPDDVTTVVVRFTTKRRARVQTERGDGYAVHAPPIGAERVRATAGGEAPRARGHKEQWSSASGSVASQEPWHAGALPPW